MNLVPLLLAATPGAYAAFAYFGVLGCYFWYDDFYWLFRWLHVPSARFLAENAPGHLLVVRNVAVSATAAVAGFDPRLYFLTVYVAHIATAVGLGLLLRRWTKRPWLAAAVGSGWAVTPLHAGTLQWYSAATHAWSGGAVVAGLLALPSRPWLAAAAFGAAAGTFGTGLATALVAPAIVLVLQPGDYRTAARMAVVAAAMLMLYLVLGFGASRMLANPAMARAMSAEGALDAPVVFAQLGVALAWVGLRDLAGPIGAVGVLLVLVAGLARMPRQVIAGLLVAGAAYGAIAIGRAGVVATMEQPLWKIAQFGHYHYAGQVGLALAFGAALSPYLGPRSERIFAVALLLSAAIRVVVAPPLIDQHDSARRTTEALARRVRAAAHSGTVLENGPFLPALTIGLFASPDRFPGTAAAAVLLFPDGTVDGRPFHFRAKGPEYLAATQGGPIEAVLLPPEIER